MPRIVEGPSRVEDNSSAFWWGLALSVTASLLVFVLSSRLSNSSVYSNSSFIYLLNNGYYSAEIGSGVL